MKRVILWYNLRKNRSVVGVIRGIGNDLIEISRVQKAMEKNPRFLTKLFTSEEQAFFKKRNNHPQIVAGRFAAKEAVAKALGTGFHSFAMADLEILAETTGKPTVRLSQKVLDALKVQEPISILVTISHSRDYAMATAVVLEGEKS